MSFTKHASTEVVSSAQTTCYTACVRYTEKTSDSYRQLPSLQPVDQPIPEDACYISPVYLLSDGQWNRLTDSDSPWKGDTSIANILQTECEEATEDGDVLYPVYLESDALEDGVETSVLFDWFDTILRELNIDPISCQYYFSGNRSIHVHTPKFAVGEEQRKLLKNKVKDFCSEHEAELDDIYKRKQTFRLPGVRHSKTELPKVEIEHGDTRKECVSKAVNAEDNREIQTPLDHFQYTHKRTTAANTALMDTTDTSYEEGLSDALLLLGGKDTGLELTKEVAEVPLQERKTPPKDKNGAKKWKRYNRHPFSPYANAGNGGRSLAFLQVKGNAYCRKNHEGVEESTFIPAKFYEAKGCGGEFTVRGPCPLRLSETDYEKWVDRGFGGGDAVAVIGGQSRSSKILKLNIRQVVEGASYLSDGGKSPAFEYLRDEGYDVGSAGSEYTENTPSSESPEQTGKSRTRELQEAVEEGKYDIQGLKHYERLSIANRLLQLQGWDEAWEWFEEQYGAEFNEGITYRQLKALVKKYDDLSHIRVPSKNKY